MRYTKYLYTVLGVALLVSCSDINDITTQGHDLSAEQVAETNRVNPERLKASVTGLYQIAALPGKVSDTDNDAGIMTYMLSADCNGPDMTSTAAGYNWYSPSSNYSDHLSSTTINAVGYNTCYNQIEAANAILRQIDESTATATQKHYIGNARFCRAFDYLLLATRYQLNYQVDKTALCVPLVTEKTADVYNNKRATVEEVYNQIISDLTSAIELLQGYERPDKRYANVAVANGLLARTYLAMGEYAKAAEYAQKAIDATDAQPASISDVSKPAFCDASKENNWMWGILLTVDDVSSQSIAPMSSQLSSFPGYGYTGAGACYKDINVLLYNKIPSTDVRKEWWVGPSKTNSHLDGLTWTEAGVTLKGNEIITGSLESKQPFRVYTNVKFGMKSGIGSPNNNNDSPLMRVEEMYLIKAEGLAMSGNLAAGKQVLEDFVKTYRDPSYSVTATTAAAFQNEVWFQRRVELWGEGFSMYDLLRLQKPLVRFHAGKETNVVTRYRFNMPANDPYYAYRFTQKERDNNKGIVDNTTGKEPVSGQNGDLRDGVTD